MSSETEGGQGLNQTRQVTIDALCEHFANDAMEMDEFERRVDVAHRATTTDELKELLRDLPGGKVPAVKGGATAPVTGSHWSLAHPDQVKDQEFVVAILGGSSRKGRWSPARKNYAMAVFGGTELDFREAVLAPGVTEVRVFALWGGVEIVVPPELNVESHGLALLGGFEHAGSDTGDADPGAPTLRITGVALMGGVEVSVRLPGESSRDARRRHRERRRELRRERHQESRGGSHRRRLPSSSDEE
jgi:hypothetical protein